MGSLSDYIENKILDHLLRNTAYTQLSHLYVGLSTVDPTDDGSGLAEPSGNGYSRVEVDDWDDASGRHIQNSGLISFPEATGDWGTITHFAVFDALTGGNMIAYGTLSTFKDVDDGGSVYFEAGRINITVSAGGLSDAYANKVLDHLFLNTALAQPTNIYAAFSAVTIEDSDTGSTITEPGGNYARTLHSVYDAASGGASENTGVITWSNADADWGTITDFALLDALTAGNIIIHSTLDTPIVVGIGDNANWIDGAMDITLD